MAGNTARTAQPDRAQPIHPFQWPCIEGAPRDIEILRITHEYELARQRETKDTIDAAFNGDEEAYYDDLWKFIFVSLPTNEKEKRLYERMKRDIFFLDLLLAWNLLVVPALDVNNVVQTESGPVQSTIMAFLEHERSRLARLERFEGTLKSYIMDRVENEFTGLDDRVKSMRLTHTVEQIIRDREGMGKSIREVLGFRSDELERKIDEIKAELKEIYGEFQLLQLALVAKDQNTPLQPNQVQYFADANIPFATTSLEELYNYITERHDELMENAVVLQTIREVYTTARNAQQAGDYCMFPTDKPTTPGFLYPEAAFKPVYKGYDYIQVDVDDRGEEDSLKTIPVPRYRKHRREGMRRPPLFPPKYKSTQVREAHVRYLHDYMGDERLWKKGPRMRAQLLRKELGRRNSDEREEVKKMVRRLADYWTDVRDSMEDDEQHDDNDSDDDRRRENQEDDDMEDAPSESKQESDYHSARSNTRKTNSPDSELEQVTTIISPTTGNRSTQYDYAPVDAIVSADNTPSRLPAVDVYDLNHDTIVTDDEELLSDPVTPDETNKNASIPEINVDGPSQTSSKASSNEPSSDHLQIPSPSTPIWRKETSTTTPRSRDRQATPQLGRISKKKQAERAAKNPNSSFAYQTPRPIQPQVTTSVTANSGRSFTNIISGSLSKFNPLNLRRGTLAPATPTPKPRAPKPVATSKPAATPKATAPGTSRSFLNLSWPFGSGSQASTQPDIPEEPVKSPAELRKERLDKEAAEAAELQKKKEKDEAERLADIRELSYKAVMDSDYIPDAEKAAVREARAQGKAYQTPRSALKKTDGLRIYAEKKMKDKKDKVNWRSPVEQGATRGDVQQKNSGNGESQQTENQQKPEKTQSNDNKQTKKRKTTEPEQPSQTNPSKRRKSGVSSFSPSSSSESAPSSPNSSKPGTSKTSSSKSKSTYYTCPPIPDNTPVTDPLPFEQLEVPIYRDSFLSTDKDPGPPCPEPPPEPPYEMIALYKIPKNRHVYKRPPTPPDTARAPLWKTFEGSEETFDKINAQIEKAQEYLTKLELDRELYSFYVVNLERELREEEPELDRLMDLAFPRERIRHLREQQYHLHLHEGAIQAERVRIRQLQQQRDELTHGVWLGNKEGWTWIGRDNHGTFDDLLEVRYGEHAGLYQRQRAEKEGKGE